MRGMSESLPVKVTVSSEELREWAGRHADAGHHGVAHVLYKAAAGVETIVEQYERERVAQPPTDAEVEAAAQVLNSEGWTCHGGGHEPGNYDNCLNCRRVCQQTARAALEAARRVGA